MGIHDETIRTILQEKDEEIALLELAFPGKSKSLWNLDTVQFEKDTFVPANPNHPDRGTLGSTESKGTTRIF